MKNQSFTVTVKVHNATFDVEVNDIDSGDFNAYYNGVNMDGLLFDMKLTGDLTLAVMIAVAEREMESAQQAVESSRESQAA